MGRMIDHKHARQPRRKEDRTAMPKPKHNAIFCEACRVMVLCPIAYDGFGNGRLIHPGDPWRQGLTGDFLSWFCSAECVEKGVPTPVREHVNAHVDFERGAVVSLERQRGRWDALMGYDCIGHRPDYVKGHGEGMDVRKIVDAAREKLKQDRGVASMPGESGIPTPSEHQLAGLQIKKDET